MSEMVDIVERLWSNEPLPVCPYDRRSPDYWSTPDNKPCKFCGGLPDGPDKCRGADTRIMAEAANLITKLRAERDAMRERCAKVADKRHARLREKAKQNHLASNTTNFAQAVEAANIAAAIRALPQEGGER